MAIRGQPMGVGFLLPQCGVCGKHLYPLSHFYSLLMLTGFCARPLISFVFPRCGSCHPCSHTADTSWQGLSWLGRVGDAAGPWVLARREPEGFYYLAQIKAAPEASVSRHTLLWVTWLYPVCLSCVHFVSLVPWPSCVRAVW